jgi:membrane fusion protein (multidrug efflux system)
MNIDSSDTPKSNARRRALSILLIALLSVIVILLARWVLHGRFHVITDDASVSGDIVLVTPQVSGTVARIRVEDTMLVKAGDVLVELNETDLRMTRERAEAEFLRTIREVQAMYAQTQSLSAEYASAQADLSVVEIDRDHAAADLKRRQAASADGGIMGEELAHAEEAQRSADARLIAATRHAESVRQRSAAQEALTAGVNLARHPRMVAAASALRTAIINESRAKIRAPIDGQIARRAVTTGALAAAGTTIMSIVPLHAVWVNANFKEAQLTNVRVGQPVEMVSDLYGSSVKFHGRISGLDAGTGSAFALLPAQNATGNWIKVVQRVPVRVELDPHEVAEHPLRVGLSMNADIDTSAQKSAQATMPAAPSPAAAGYENSEIEADAIVATMLRQAFNGSPKTVMHVRKERAR